MIRAGWGQTLSRVITARLNGSRDSERQALEIYDGLRRDGHDARYIITAALLALGQVRIPPPPPATNHQDAGPALALLQCQQEQAGEIARLLHHLGQVVNDLTTEKRGLSPSHDEVVNRLSDEGISRQFLANIESAVKFDEVD